MNLLIQLKKHKFILMAKSLKRMDSVANLQKVGKKVLKCLLLCTKKRKKNNTNFLESDQVNSLTLARKIQGQVVDRGLRHIRLFRVPSVAHIM